MSDAADRAAELAERKLAPSTADEGNPPASNGGNGAPFPALDVGGLLSPAIDGANFLSANSAARSAASLMMVKPGAVRHGRRSRWSGGPR